MTQTMLSPTTVEQMKVPYSDLYCEADTLMQIGNEVIDMVESIDTKDCEKSKEKEMKETVVKMERSRSKAQNMKARKPRRMRKKSSRQHQHPYNNLERAQAQLARRQKIRAPVNTTQFLISDRANFDTYSDSENENKFEGNFAQKEFYKEYENEASKQKTKSKLIEDFVTLEKDIVLLEKRYEDKRAQEQLKARLGAVDYDFEKGEVAMEPEVAEKIRILHEEIVKLSEENRLLQDENSLLKSGSSGFTTDSSGSSSDSDSDSSSSEDESDSDSSSSSSSSEDEDEAEENPNEAVPSSTEEAVQSNLATDDLEQRREDTGYESDSNDLTRVTSTTFRK